MAVEGDSQFCVLLEASLQEGCGLQELRLLCRGQTIPDHVRGQIWHRLLGLSASCTNSLDSFHEIFDLSNQSALRDDCSKLVYELANDEEDKVCILSDLESLLTHYCKSYKKVYQYENGWLHILKVLVSMKLTKNELYQFFTSIMETCIPRNIHGGAMNLFRLLLLYHDPKLCSFLDSHKIAPDLYIDNWFSSLFGASCNIPAVLALWDYYFVHGDPFLIFFLSLVLIINAKDDIIYLKGDKEKILDLIAGLPRQMEAADVQDFCSLAVLYSAQTPVSYKREYHQILFGEGADIEDQNSIAPLLSQALCLPVSVQELLFSCKLVAQPSKDESEMRALRFFLVDCRPADQYNAGHLPTAFHLDSNLMLTEPQAFGVAVQALLSAQKQSIAAQSAAGGEHLIFFGSGREAEDQYVHMVVAFFLQRHVQFVGLVQGGFEAVHQALVCVQMENGASSNPTEPVGLIDHNSIDCLVCRQKATSLDGGEKNEGSDLSKIIPTKINFFERIRSRSTVVKEKLANYIVNPNSASPSDHSNDFSSKSGKRLDNAVPISKNKSSTKLYRNLAPIFSIDDDQEEDDEPNFEGVSEHVEDSHHQELVAISAWLKKPEVINSFRCSEIKESGHAYSSYLLITPTHLFVLREIQNRSGFARISVNRTLTSIMKITSKKRHPEFITFKYGSVNGEETIITDMDRFIIPQAGDAVKLVKQQLFANPSLSY